MEHDDGQLLISYLGRHLLCLYIRYRAIDANGAPVGPEYQSATSCFVIELLDEWLLITAGHVFHNPEKRDGFDDMIEDKKIVITRTCLLEGFGHEGKSFGENPFPYDAMIKTYVNRDELGLDFAIIHLSYLYREGFRKTGILPIGEPNWTNGLQQECQAYFMLGFPAEQFAERNKPIEWGHHQDVIIAPTLVPIRHLKGSEIPDFAEQPENGFPWFTGQVVSNIKTVKGISGGPIFGVIQKPYRSLLYWTIAVQSSEFQPSKVIRGCPILFFVELLKRQAEQIDKTGSSI